MTKENLQYVVSTDSSAGERGFQNIARSAKKFLGATEDSLDDTRTAAQRMADGIEAMADDAKTEFTGLRSAATKLADALGPEMAAKIGQANIDRFVQQLRAADIEFEDIEANAEQLARAVGKLDDARPAIKNMQNDLAAVSLEGDKTRGVMANLAGNAVQELPGVSAALGPVGVAAGQLGEYFTEGDIKLRNLLTTAGGLAAFGIAWQVITTIMESNDAAQARVEERSEAVAETLDDQVTKTYELAAANAAAEGSLDGLAIAADALNRSITITGDQGELLTESLGALGMQADEGLAAITRMRTGNKEYIEELLRSSGAFEGYEDRMAEIIAKGDDWEEMMNYRLKRPTDETSIAVEELTTEQIALIRAIEGVEDAAQETDLQQITKQFLDNKVAANEAGRELVLLAEAQTGVSRADDALVVYQRFNVLLAEADAATRDAILGTNEYEDAQRAAADAAKAHADELANEIDRLNELVDAQRSVADSTYAQADAVDRQIDYMATLNERVEAAGDNQFVLNALYREGTEVQAKVADANVRLAEDQATANGVTLTATAKLDLWNQSMLLAANSAEGPLRTSILEYIATANGIPDAKVTEINAALDAGDYDTALRLLNDAAKTRTATIEADALTTEADAALDAAARPRTATITAITLGTAGPGNKYGKHAHGGFAGTGQGGIAGENYRPERLNGELITEPTLFVGPAKVQGENATAAELAANRRPSVVQSNTTHHHYYPTGTTPDLIEAEQRRWSRRNGPL